MGDGSYWIIVIRFICGVHLQRFERGPDGKLRFYSVLSVHHLAIKLVGKKGDESDCQKDRQSSGDGVKINTLILYLCSDNLWLGGRRGKVVT